MQWLRKFVSYVADKEFLSRPDFVFVAQILSISLFFALEFCQEQLWVSTALNLVFI